MKKEFSLEISLDFELDEQDGVNITDDYVDEELSYKLRVIADQIEEGYRQGYFESFTWFLRPVGMA